MNSSINKSCSSCSALFSCSFTETCWCNAFPVVFAPIVGIDCLCPNCLATKNLEEKNNSAILQKDSNAKENELVKNSR